MAIVYDDLKAIFIRIPKTGSASMMHILKKYKPKRKKIFPKWCLENEINNKGISQYMIDIVPQSSWDTYFKFAFVRNPWDRYVSGWKHMIRDGHMYSSFVDFVQNPREHYAKQKNRKVVLHTQMVQWRQLVDKNDKIAVDFIGRYENMNNDFAFVCKKLDIPFGKLPHKNQSNTMHYSKFYTEEAKEIIAERFKEDIDAFGYTYEGDVQKEYGIWSPGYVPKEKLRHHILRYCRRKLRKCFCAPRRFLKSCIRQFMSLFQ